MSNFILFFTAKVAKNAKMFNRKDAETQRTYFLFVPITRFKFSYPFNPLESVSKKITIRME